MPNYAARERPYRTRTHIREEAPKQDAITSALTAQLIICVILILLAMLMKKVDNEGFIRVKNEYDTMLSDYNQTDRAIEWISDSGGVFSGILNTLKQKAEGILPEKQPVTEPEAEPEDEPEDEPENGPEQPAHIEYNYLVEKDVAYIGSSGGMLAAMADTGGMMSPPAGSTISPVYLSAKMKPPITGIITSDFAYRYHPLTGTSDFHTGLDVAAEEGRAILAALPGEVVEVGDSQTYGKYIVLQHAINLQTSYSHCSEIIAEEGMAVRQGERIALVGETGVATGPHLHFSVIVEGEFTDPSWVLGDYIQLVEE